MSFEEFLSEFYYPDEIVTETESNIEVLSISRAFPVWSRMLKNLTTLFGRALV